LSNVEPIYFCYDNSLLQIFKKGQKGQFLRKEIELVDDGIFSSTYDDLEIVDNRSTFSKGENHSLMKLNSNMLIYDHFLNNDVQNIEKYELPPLYDLTDLLYL